MSDDTKELMAALKRAQETTALRLTSHVSRNARDQGVGVEGPVDYRETCERGHTTECSADQVPILVASHS